MGAKFAYVPEVLAELIQTEGSLTSNITRHMRNRLHVRQHHLSKALHAGVLSTTEWKLHRRRLIARCQAIIAMDQARHRHPIAALQAAARVAAACISMAAGGDWETTRELALATRRQLANMTSPVRSFALFRAGESKVLGQIKSE